MTNISLLQHWLFAENIDGLIIPSTDEYLSKFLPEHAKRLQWACGFSGSMGTAIILHNKAVLFVDGRYNVQAEIETRGLDVEIVVISDAIMTPLKDKGLRRWIAQNMSPMDILAFDPALHPHLQVAGFLESVDDKTVQLKVLSTHPIDVLWQGRPLPEESTVYAYPLVYAGQSYEEKRRNVLSALSDQGQNAYLVSDPEDIAWLLNCRADDLPITPVCLSTVFLNTDGELSWFVDRARVDKAFIEQLGDDVTIMRPESITDILPKLASRKIVGVNMSRTTHKLVVLLSDGAVPAKNVIDNDAICRMRWIKNEQELAGVRNAHHVDAIAVIRFMAWLDKNILVRKVTELDAANQLIQFRQEQRFFKGLSMPVMSASGPNTAIPHYIPTEQTNLVINNHPIYWVDSGGHYFGGSTDNTLAMAIGDPEPKHKVAHTLVLKGYIAVATAHFPKGTKGIQLDMLARQFIWSVGVDFAHGTGHGVGSFLGIHEDIKMAPFCDRFIEEGMVLSNEPGYYADGDFGIRIESHLIVVPSTFQSFLTFETVSRLPIDPRLVDVSLLSEKEKWWLADYHQTLSIEYQELLDPDVASYLKGIVEFFVDLSVA